ncbi:MAG: peptide deformylase [Candidatus Wildermuthbacteria bacterium]|nr:peptide deformylase [Candidatus Wildermuthbacteria bacterium]
MTSLPIVKYPQEILRKPSQPIETITPQIQQLIPRMVEAMKENKGIGLAGPQIDIAKQVIIVQDSRSSHGFINPKILSKSKEQSVEEEGCLSLPGIFLPIRRSEKVEVTCLTPDGREVRIEAEGLIARIFQHEIDHINGFLIIDRVSPLKRLKIRKLLMALEHG